MLCILHLKCSSSLYALIPIFFRILNGPYFFGASFFEGRFVLIFRLSSITKSPSSNMGASESFLS